MTTKPKLVVVAGSTASGKSDLAVEIAKLFNGEVVSADSRQVYRGLDIGSNKVPISYEPPRGASTKSSIPNAHRRGGIAYYKGIRHHMLDVASPKRTFTAAQYQKHAKNAIKNILKREKLPIVCGGTGFYIDALIHDYTLPRVQPQKSLRRKLEKQPTEELVKLLVKYDPARAKAIDTKNRRRLIRTLEIVLTTGEPLPQLKTSSPYNLLIIGITVSLDELKRRIEKRLRERLKKGMAEEVAGLHEEGVSWQRLYDLGLEYRYISLYLRGELTKQEMIDMIERESYRYAKRQMTWFKKNKAIQWIKNTEQAPMLVENFLNYASFVNNVDSTFLATSGSA